MLDDMRLVETEIYSVGCTYPVSNLRKRNLGGAIFLAAIEDYLGLDEKVHQDAEQFLYPRTKELQDHYDWAVGLADGTNPAWLRDALDRFKAKWDGQRQERKRLRRRRAS